jgi:hypothetical protein
MEKKDPREIMQEFKRRQSRQIISIAAIMFLVLLCAVIYKRPALLGGISKGALFGVQVAGIAAFLVYSAVNWRCPSCGSGLGTDIHKQVCRKCGAKLQ